VTPATVERPGVWPTITKGWTDMPDDTPALTSHDLETIKTALPPVWFDLQSRGEHPAADWIGARINDGDRCGAAPSFV
jgi:hypothetical protein